MLTHAKVTRVEGQNTDIDIAGNPFLESSSNVTGPEPYFEIEIYSGKSSAIHSIYFAN